MYVSITGVITRYKVLKMFDIGEFDNAMAKKQ